MSNNEAPIGIVCATASEAAPFFEHLEGARAGHKALMDIRRGALSGMPAVVVCCGIGKTNAAMAAQALIDEGARAIVNPGAGGGISPEVGLFDIVVAECVQHHDVDAQTMLVESFPHYPSGVFACDEALVAAARAAATSASIGGQVRYGKTVSGEQFIDDAQRDSIVKATGGLAVDMEGAAIGQVCFANGVPFITVRSITDTAAHDGYGNYEANAARAASEVFAFTREMLLHLG